MKANAQTSSTHHRPRPKLPSGTVKSAGRVLQILEYFDEIHRPATVAEIAVALGMPQSSVWTLLRSLTGMGYLQFDRMARTYIPTCRVALLGNWVSYPFFVGGAALSCIEELQMETESAVFLATRNGSWAQYIHVKAPSQQASEVPPRGSLRPLVNSGAGLALLSTLPEADVRKIAHRANAEGFVGAGSGVNTEKLIRKVERARMDGYALEASSSDDCMVAMPVPIPSNDGAMVIGVVRSVFSPLAGWSEAVGAMRAIFDKHLACGAIDRRQLVTLPLPSVLREAQALSL